jgi:hypothetical protein
MFGKQKQNLSTTHGILPKRRIWKHGFSATSCAQEERPESEVAQHIIWDLPVIY